MSVVREVHSFPQFFQENPQSSSSIEMVNTCLIINLTSIAVWTSICSSSDVWNSVRETILGGVRN